MSEWDACSRCGKEHDRRLYCVEKRVPRVSVLVFWNDHGPLCTCFECVLRRAETNAKGGN